MAILISPRVRKYNLETLRAQKQLTSLRTLIPSIKGNYLEGALLL